MGKTDYPKILIVEDDVDQCMLLCEALCMHYQDPQGTNLATAGTVGECLAQDLASFDIVLMDYHLPDGTGVDLLKEVLDRADLPVIFVTGENNSQTAARAIQNGAQDYVIKMGDYLFAMPVVIDKNIGQHKIKKDNDRLQRQLKEMLHELQVKNEQLEDSLAKLETAASTDPVTGLANRRRFNELLHRYHSEAARYGSELTCCMCDLDHYKEFNDTFGHQVGDDILVATAEIIRTSLRESDMAARYGGDEFVLLLPHTPISRALTVGERIRRELAEVGHQRWRLEHTLSLSVGIASLMANRPENADELVSMADRALYTAKDRGKDQIVVFSGRQEAAGVPAG